MLVFGLLRERIIEALIKNSKVSFATRFYNLLDDCFKGQQIALALKQRQNLLNEYVSAHYGQKVQLVDWRLREGRKRPEGTRRLRWDVLERLSGSPDQIGVSQAKHENSERSSKRLIMLMVSDQRQKNQEIEDELRLTKLKLQQELKAKRYSFLEVKRAKKILRSAWLGNCNFSCGNEPIPTMR